MKTPQPRDLEGGTAPVREESSEGGPRLAEYAAALALIAVAAIVVLALLGGSVSQVLSTISGSV